MAYGVCLICFEVRRVFLVSIGRLNRRTSSTKGNSADDIMLDNDAQSTDEENGCNPWIESKYVVLNDAAAERDPITILYHYHFVITLFSWRLPCKWNSITKQTKKSSETHVLSFLRSASRILLHPPVSWNCPSSWSTSPSPSKWWRFPPSSSRSCSLPLRATGTRNKPPICVYSVKDK